jgi:hypothetical protein
MAALAEQAHVPEKTGDILDQALYDKDHRSRFGGDETDAGKAPKKRAGKKAPKT